MTQPDRTRTPLAVLGQPDPQFEYHMGKLKIPYLNFSQKELDLIDAAQRTAPEDLDEDELTDFVTEKRKAETDLAFEMLSRRFPRATLTWDEVYRTINPADLWAWVNSLFRGEKGEPKRATEQAPPAG